MRLRVRWFVVPPVCIIAALVIIVAVSLTRKPDILAQRNTLITLMRQYPNGSRAQRMALLRERQNELRPKWRDLTVSQIAHRLLQIATSSGGATQPETASFLGNSTAITSPAGTVLGLERTANCTLTMGYANYTLNLPGLSYTVPPLTPNYDQLLHEEAGLTTTGGSWPAGCGDPVIGMTSRSIVPLGQTVNKIQVGAAVGYDAASGNEVVYTITGAPAILATASTTLGEISIANASPVAVASADLNGDGNGDLVIISDSSTTTGTASVSVLLGNADGTLQSPVTYPLSGVVGVSAVIDDFDGDGFPDIVASTEGAGTSYLTFLKGSAAGTFTAAAPVTLTAPSGFQNLGQSPYFGLISADLLGSGKKDLVTSTGVVLMGNGDGTFTQSASLAFPNMDADSDFGPNVIAADFNKDGHLDLAVDDGETLSVYLGKGDGTFTAGASYGSIDNTGAINAADLDGDGNVDVYSGTQHGGYLGGDQFETNEAYAYMGNGDGTLRGAPALPFLFTGQNMAELNGDSYPDGVGLNVNPSATSISFTSYLGTGKGTFAAGPNLDVSTITISGTPYTLGGVQSFALGDTRGVGKTDLVFLPSTFSGPNGSFGYFVATGNGDGSFNAPTFVAAPTFQPVGDFDDQESLTNLFVADINGDGKADLIYNYSSVGYYSQNYVEGIAVQLSNGDGTFQAPQIIQTYSSKTAPPPLPPILVQVTPTRANGKPDIFVETQSIVNASVVAQLELYLGNGDGTFGAATMPPVADNINVPFSGYVLGQIVAADMNGDGKLDLITLGNNGSTGQAEVAISLGNGDGTFQKPTIVNFGGGSSEGYGLAVADFSGDGKQDIAVTGFNPPYDTGIFTGNGDGTVQTFNAGNGLIEPAEGIYLLAYGSALAIDLNDDGKPDLVAGDVALLNQPGSTTTLIGTSTSLTASANNVTAGTSVTLNSTVTPASGSGTPTGTVTFMDGATTLSTQTLSSGAASFSTSSLAIGTHTITAVYSGDSNYSGSTSAAVTVTVTAASMIGTTTSLTASASSINTGASVTFNSTVTPASGSGTPTGMVVFMDGTTTLSTQTLASGAASYSTSSLAAGTHTITAVYSGDSTYSGSTSTAVTVTVTTVTPTFSISDSPTSGSVKAGQSSTTTVTVTPANGFNQQVSFACTGLPTGATCTFNPTTVTPSGSAVTSTLTIATSAQSSALAPLFVRSGITCALLLPATGVLWFWRRRKGGLWGGAPLALLCLLMAGIVAAGCGTTRKPETSTITITATAGSEAQTATYTLTVNF